MGEKTRVDSVVIYWPSGKKQVERPAETDRFVEFTESNFAAESAVRSADTAEASLDGNADEAMRRFWEQAALTLPEKVRVPVAAPPALEPLLAAHSERPNDLDALLDLSDALLARRAYGQAKGYLRQALEMAPGDARIHWAMGRMLSDLGDLSGAVESLARAAEARTMRWQRPTISWRIYWFVSNTWKKPWCATSARSREIRATYRRILTWRVCTLAKPITVLP